MRLPDLLSRYSSVGETAVISDIIPPSNRGPVSENLGRIWGELSEQVVFQLLNNDSIWYGMITNVERNIRFSLEDSNGIDIEFFLHPLLANALGMTKMRVQVKSNPQYILWFIEKKINQKIAEGRLRGTKHHPIVDECLIFLNGGRGEVSITGLVAPLVAQLRLFARLRGVVINDVELKAIFDSFNSKIWHMYENGLSDLIPRDYGDTLVTIEALERQWQLGIRPRVDQATQNMYGGSTSMPTTTNVWVNNPHGSRLSSLPIDVLGKQNEGGSFTDRRGKEERRQGIRPRTAQPRNTFGRR